jgi:hypothetical protein
MTDQAMTLPGTPVEVVYRATSGTEKKVVLVIEAESHSHVCFEAMDWVEDNIRDCEVALTATDEPHRAQVLAA